VHMPDIQEKSLTLEVKVSPVEPRVRTDQHYLRQIIDNMLKNAVKFTPSGGIKIEVLPVMFNGGVSEAVKPPERFFVQNGEWIVLRITDTGIGIRAEDQEIIFESFRQVDNSGAREYNGTGLGLAITRRLVELHEGYIWVESAVDQGSVFTVLFPAFNPDIPTDTFDPAAVQRDSRPLVLVVDDDPVDRQLVQDYLDGEAYQVVGTANSAGAFELARQLQPDLVITDVMMEDVNGWDVLRALKADDATAHIPVIVHSALDQKPRGMGLGAADYLVKPVEREQFQTQVRRALKQAHE